MTFLTDISLIGLGLVFAFSFGFLGNRDLDEREAASLAATTLKLLETDPQAVRDELVWGDPASIDAIIASPQTFHPLNITMTTVDNRLLIGGLDEKSISEVYGEYICVEGGALEHYSIRYIFDPWRQTWRVSNVSVPGCF